MVPAKEWGHDSARHKKRNPMQLNYHCGLGYRSGHDR
jgi:hypothetical protein